MVFPLRCYSNFCFLPKEKDWPKNGQNWHFGSFWARPCRLIWCPVGGLVGGSGACAVSRKTPIYFICTFYMKPGLIMDSLALIGAECQENLLKNGGGTIVMVPAKYFGALKYS